MTRTPLERLHDARDYALHALETGGGPDGAALQAAPQSLRAVLFDLIIIGETLGKIPGDIQSLEPDLPWRMIYDMRNLLVHAYWQIDVMIVAEVLSRDLKPLVSNLERLIARLERESP